MLYIIYKIVIDDYIYIGSTQNYTRRKSQHKRDCNNNKDILLYRKINELGNWNNCLMSPLETYECETTIEAHIREEFYRQRYEANLNSIRCHVSENDNYEHLKAYQLKLKEIKEIHYKNIVANIKEQGEAIQTVPLYDEVINSNTKMEDHIQIINLMKTTTYIDEEITKLADNNYNSPLYKIRLLMQFERNMKISRLEIDQSKAEFCIIPDDIFTLIKKHFRFTKAKPTNIILLFQLYINMVKNIGGKDIIITTQHEHKKVKTRIYKLNAELIKQHLILDSFENPLFQNYDESFKQWL
jgi:hypothetical protein